MQIKGIPIYIYVTVTFIDATYSNKLHIGQVLYIYSKYYVSSSQQRYKKKSPMTIECDESICIWKKITIDQGCERGRALHTKWKADTNKCASVYVCIDICIFEGVCMPEKSAFDYNKSCDDCGALPKLNQKDTRRGDWEKR